MMKRRVSSHDVARLAGVSQSTVSLVLSGRAGTRISAETRQRVLDAAEQLHYTINVAARALVTGRTNRLAVVPIHPGGLLDRDLYYGQVLSGITLGALQANHNLLLHSANYPDWLTLQRDILNGSSDGALLIGRPKDDPLTKALLDAGFPTVCISYHISHPACVSVDCDNVAGGRIAVQHLLECGHTNIALLAPSEDGSWVAERRQGAEEALRLAGLDPSVMLTLGTEFSAQTEGWLERLADRLHSASPRPNGLFCNEESQARVLVEALGGQGLWVPEDLAVVSFNSTDLSARARPPITSVRQPLGDIGKEAVRLLHAIIAGEEVPPGVRRLPVVLDVRATTCSEADSP
ncbi:MAG: transcriptional regulator, LacI family [Chthonomonadaceae bacterium]|nr:transcriptional regulator, LacI family [Chthonomonadaceae bacterium]